MIGEYFEVDMCDDDLKCLNRILVNEELDFIDTENAFLIASFLKSNVSLNGNEISLLKYFTDFCLDERVNNKEVFSILLSAISEKVSDVIDKIETNVKNIELLEIIIFTIILVGLDNLELNEGEYLNILLRILNSNLDSQSYSFIRVLFGNNVMKNNVNKRKIIFEEILKKNGRILALNDKKHIMMDIFCDENMLIMDDIAYKKVVDSIIEGDIIKTYLLEVVMKLSGLTFVKRCLLIEYYCNMIEKNKHIYSLDLVKRMLSQREINIFNIIYCDNLINMEDEAFGCVLKNVVDSNNPLSYLKVFTSSVVNEEQRMLALNLVNQGCTRSIRNNSAEDYNDAVAMAAISPVLVERPIDEYFNMLLRINCWCKQFDTLCFNGRIDKRVVFKSISCGVVRLLNSPNLYGHNISRLYKTIDVLLSVDSSEKLIKDLVDFGCSDVSFYYTDSEYMRALELIKGSYDKKMYSVVKNLFINVNVPFMEDKSILFDAVKSSEKSIVELTESLNKKGNYNKNMAAILDGVDDDMTRLVVGPNVSRIKRPIIVN